MKTPVSRLKAHDVLPVLTPAPTSLSTVTVRLGYTVSGSGRPGRNESVVHALLHELLSDGLVIRTVGPGNRSYLWSVPAERTA